LTDTLDAQVRPIPLIHLSLSAGFRNKEWTRASAFSTGWKPAELSLEELAKHIDQGLAFGPQFEGGRRKTENFRAAGFVAIDVDGTMTIEGAKSLDFIKQYGSILYTTASHRTEGRDHFRVVFATPSPIESARIWKCALLGLAKRCNSDRSVADGARIFFGSQCSNPVILGNVLTDSALAELVRLGRAELADIAEDSDDSMPIEARTRRSMVRVRNDQPIVTATGQTWRLSDLPTGTRVFCPFHDDARPSAFTLFSKKSGAPGIYCSACHETFFLEGTPAPEYDFQAFEKWADSLAENADWVTNPPIGSAAVREVHIMNSKYLPGLPPSEGSAFTKSPKGSGKTERISEIVNDAKLMKKSVLLIGHRRLLLRELASRVGLICYLDDDGLDDKRKPKIGDTRSYYAVSVDSLPTKMRRSRRDYDIVIIDECEQVLAHAVSKTVKKQVEAINALQRYVTKASSLYLFDADINHITHNFVSRCRSDRVDDPTRVYLNTYVEPGRTFDVFPTSNDLVADLIATTRSGKRSFVVCNSKRFAKIVHRTLTKEFNENCRLLLITAEGKAERDVQDLLHDVKQKILDYEVVIASPAIGTGIDITFQDNQQLIDVVYGFFRTGINSHYDCDQQLGRVRNPGNVKVWIDQQRHSFETDSNAIICDLVESGEVEAAVKGFSRAGDAVIDSNHPIVQLKADVYCAQRASQNNLKLHFLKHKGRDGWVAKFVMAEASSAAAKQKVKNASGEIDAEYVAGVVAATKISLDEYRELVAQRESENSVNLAGTNQLARFEIERFYGEEISEGLVLADKNGRLREQVLLYESLGLMTDAGRDRTRQAWASFKSGNKFVQAFHVPLDQAVLLAVLCSAVLVCGAGLDTEKALVKADLSDFQNFCNERRTTIERALTLQVRNDLGRDPLRMLNVFLERIGQSAERSRTYKSSGKKVYEYRLSEASFAMVDRIARRREERRSTDEDCDVEEDDRRFVTAVRVKAEPAPEANLARFIA